MTSLSGAEAGFEHRARSGRTPGGIRLLGLDLDGTLVDSAPDLCSCLGDALEFVGLSRPTEAQTLAWVGDGVDELLRRALVNAVQSAGTANGEEPAEASERLFARAFAAFSSCYERNLFVRSTLYPAVADTLSRLAECGIKLCCITNKRTHLATALLEQAGIRRHFDLVIGGDSLPDKKPSPVQLEAAATQLGVASPNAVFVGDSDHDFKAARAAGWRFVWAAYGYRRSIEDADESIAVIHAFRELPALLSAANER